MNTLHQILLENVHYVLSFDRELLSLFQRAVAQKNIMFISPSKQRELYFLITSEFQPKSAVLILYFVPCLHFTFSQQFAASVCMNLPGWSTVLTLQCAGNIIYWPCNYETQLLTQCIQCHAHVRCNVITWFVYHKYINYVLFLLEYLHW